MGVAVDEARRDHMAFGVEAALGERVDAADAGDAAVLDSDIGAIARHSRAVDYHAVADHEVVGHARYLPCLSARPS